MQLKSRQLLLFIIACALLIYTKLSVGSLIAMATLMQLMVLIQKLEFSRRSQIASFKLFLFSIPLFIFWGGVRTFVTIYYAEQQLIFLLMALIIVFILSMLIGIQVVLAFTYLEQNDFKVMITLQKSYASSLKNIKLVLKTGLLIFVFSSIPFISADWQLVFSVMATHLYMNWAQVKTALSNS